MVCGDYSRDQIVILILTLTATILSGSALGLPPPFVPQLDEKYNLSSAVTGWIIGTFPLVHFLCIPIISKYVTKIGLYEVNVWGLLFNGGCTVLFGTLEHFPPVENGINWAYIITAFIIRAFQAIGASCWYNASMTILANSFPNHATLILSYAETLFTLGAMASPAVGSVLYEVGGFMGVFGGVGAARMLISILMHFFLPKCQKTENNDGNRNGEAQSLKSILSDLRITGGLILLIYGGVIWASLEPILEPELRVKFGLSTSVSALCFVILAGTYSITSQFVAKALEHRHCIDRILLMAIGLIISAVAYLFAGPPPFLTFLPRPLWVLLTCVGLLGMSCSLLVITSLNLLFHRDPADDGASDVNAATNSILVGLFAAAIDIGAIIGPVVAGAITARTSFAMTTTYFCGFSLLCLVFALILYCLTKTMTRSHSHSLPDETTLLLSNNDMADQLKNS